MVGSFFTPSLNNVGPFLAPDSRDKSEITTPTRISVTTKQNETKQDKKTLQTDLILPITNCPKDNNNISYKERIGKPISLVRKQLPKEPDTGDRKGPTVEKVEV